MRRLLVLMTHGFRRPRTSGGSPAGTGLPVVVPVLAVTLIVGAAYLRTPPLTNPSTSGPTRSRIGA